MKQIEEEGKLLKLPPPFNFNPQEERKCAKNGDEL